MILKAFCEWRKTSGVNKSGFIILSTSLLFLEVICSFGQDIQIP